jgi:hypothetical protein
VHCRHSLRRRHRRSAAKLWRPFPSLVICRRSVLVA